MTSMFAVSYITSYYKACTRSQVFGDPMAYIYSS